MKDLFKSLPLATALCIFSLAGPFRPRVNRLRI